MHAWGNAANIDFQQVFSDYNNVDIYLTFWGDSYDGSCEETFRKNVLAHTITDVRPVRIHFSGEYTWTLDDRGKQCLNRF